VKEIIKEETVSFLFNIHLKDRSVVTGTLPDRKWSSQTYMSFNSHPGKIWEES